MRWPLMVGFIVIATSLFVLSILIKSAVSGLI